MLASVPLPAVVAAGVVIALAVLLPLLPKPAPAPPPARDIPAVAVCEKGVDFETAEDLMKRPEPCVVRGLEPELVAKLTNDWSLASLSALPESEMMLRTSQGKKHSRVMLHTPKGFKDVNFRDDVLKLRWPTGPYDDSWSYDSVKVTDLLSPPAEAAGRNFSASFSNDVSMLTEIMPGVVETATSLSEAICPYGCPDSLIRQSIVWMESRGLGQQMHMEQSTTMLFHTSGERQFVLAPPEQMLRKAHMFPHVHPNRQQSQLHWNAETYDRDLAGYIYDGSAAAPAYDTSKEQLAQLNNGDVLYIPAFWGRQTFAGMNAPTLSVSITLFPTAVGPEERPGDRGPWGSVLNPEHPESERGARAHKALEEAVNSAGSKCETGAEKWAALRELGRSLAQHMFHVSEEESLVLMKEWIDQRWAPLFDGLSGEQFDSIETSDLVCVSWPESAEWGQKLAPLFEWSADWHIAADRDAILFFELANVLDILLKAGLGYLATEEGTDPVDQLGAALGSFTSCDAAAYGAA
jgi:hypothetical protein